MQAYEQSLDEQMRKSLAAMRLEQKRRNRANLARCLDEWRNYALRRRPLRPTESREIIQDQACQQLLLEITGAMK